MSPRRATTQFTKDDVSDAEQLTRSLTDFSSDVSSRLAALEACARVRVLDDIIVEMGSSIAVNTAPFPLQVQTPFSVAGAWVVACEAVALGEAGIPTAGVAVWGRPVSGGTDGQGNAYEIQFITGLTASRQYRLRLAVVGVKNG